MFRRINIE